MRKVFNSVFALILVVGLGLLGYAAYGHFDTKQQEKAAAEQADNLLADRDPELVTPTADAPDTERSLLANWEAKQGFMPKLVQGEAFGKLLLPSIGGELPIVEGVDADDLSKGVGHDEDTLLPLDNGQIVLSGHRDTVFRGIGKMEIGDTMIVQMPYGDFEYRITETLIVDADDRTVIVPHDAETLTVTTCYPFDFIGSAPDRYIIHAEPVFDLGELDVTRLN